MKKLAIIIVIAAISLKMNCQIINMVNVETGISVSRQDFIYNSSMVGYSEYAGVEYLDLKIYRDIHMNLNSNIGIIRKGGQFKNPEDAIMYSDLDFTDEKLRLNYFSINTTADFKYPLRNNFTPFIGLGPFFEMLISHSDLYRQFYEIQRPQTLGYGLLLNLGIKYDYNQFQFSLKWAYFFNFNNVSNWLGKDIDGRTFTISLVAGYTLNESHSSRRR